MHEDQPGYICRKFMRLVHLTRLKNAAVQTVVCSIILVLSVASCRENKLEVDVSNINAEVDIHRFDRQLFDWSIRSFRQEAPALIERYPDFYRHYFEDVIGIGPADDSLLYGSIRLFTSDPSIQELHEAVEGNFNSLEDIEVQLESAWKHYKYYFPESEVPKHISFLGVLGANVMVMDDEVGIGLDAYLGSDEEIYELAQVPKFLRKKMIPERIAPDVIHGWMETEFVLEEKRPTLLEVIVHEGRILYALDACFPRMEDSLKIGYTGSQMEWAQTYEQNVWTFFIDKELLFKNDFETLNKYVSDGPFTTGFAKDSPARMGVYIGWQMVRSYMEHHPEKNLKDLMDINDAQEILSNSKYKH